MKTLYEYIKENINRDTFSFEGINNEIQDSIHEAITRSYDTDKLIDKISNRYNIDKHEFVKTNTNSSNRAFHVKRELIESHLNDKWLNDILTLFGYYITVCGRNFIIFEPIFTDNITDKIQDDCEGKIYKIVKSDIADGIRKKKGLYTDKDNLFKELEKLSHSKDIYDRKQSSKDIYDIMRNSSRINDFSYRMFHSRLFFFSASDKNGLANAFKEVIKQLNIQNDNYEVLEIDISNYNVNCYVDTFSGDNMRNIDYYLFYVNAFFPLNMIKFYSPNEFEKLLS